MRLAVSIALSSLLFVAASAGALAAHAASRAPVKLRVEIGYDNQYRPSGWAPVHVTLRNLTAKVESGTVVIPEQADTSQFASQSFHALYQTGVVLPPHGAKHVTLYLPGESIGDFVTAQFAVAGKVVASATDAPTVFDDQAVTVGVLGTDPQLTAWLTGLKATHANLSIVRLAPAALDPVADALAAFDTIVISDVDTSVLNRDQTSALGRYVRDGGALLLVGGTNWQQTLRPLPAAILPGVLSGSRVVSDLSGLQPLAGPALPRRRTVVSVLAHPRGIVLAQENHVPLVVRTPVGSGRLIYLAFDPATDTATGGATRLLGNLVMQAAPRAAGRLAASSVQFGFSHGRFGPNIMRQELANMPAATWPAVVFLVTLLLAGAVLVGPVHLLVLRWLHKVELALITVPVLSVVCLGSTVAVAGRFEGNLTLVNTVTVVRLDGTTTQPRSATMYVGLFAPMSGDYHLVWQGRALPQALPQYSRDFFGTPSGASPLGVRLQEGVQTEADFLSMNMWSSRSLTLKTTVSVPGRISSRLHIAQDGAIVGTVRNDTDLTLIRPVLLAGNAVLHLADLPPGSTRAVRIVPSVDTSMDQTPPFWDRIYGPSSVSEEFASWDGDPWEEPSTTSESTLTDRLRNVMERLPDIRDFTSLGEVSLLAWNEDHLGAMTVNGATPRRRDLNLIISPLSVSFPRGPFRLRPGTVGAYLVDAHPQPLQNGCCFSSLEQPAFALGPGGSATFEFDFARRGLRFHDLELVLNVDGAYEAPVGEIFDWRAQRWVSVGLPASAARLSHPDRYFSPTGSVLVRVLATKRSGDVAINDPRQDLQLSGWATAG